MSNSILLNWVVKNKKSFLISGRAEQTECISIISLNKLKQVKLQHNAKEQEYIYTHTHTYFFHIAKITNKLKLCTKSQNKNFFTSSRTFFIISTLNISNLSPEIPHITTLCMKVILVCQQKVPRPTERWAKELPAYY